MNSQDREIVPLPIRVERWLKNELQTLADQDDRSLNAYCVKILDAHVKAEKEKKDG